MKFVDSDNNLICEVIELNGYFISIIPEENKKSKGILVKKNDDLTLIPENEINMFHYPMMVTTNDGFILDKDVYLYKSKDEIPNKCIPVFHSKHILKENIKLPDNFSGIQFLIDHFGFNYLLNDNILTANDNNNINISYIEHIYNTDPNLLKLLILSNIYTNKNGIYKNIFNVELNLLNTEKINDNLYFKHDDMFDVEIENKNLIIPKSKYTYDDLIHIVEDTEKYKKIYNKNILNRIITSIERLEKMLQHYHDNNIELNRNHIKTLDFINKYYKKNAI